MLYKVFNENLNENKIIMFTLLWIGALKNCVKTLPLITLFWNCETLFSEITILKVIKAILNLWVKNIQCSYLGIGPHTLDPSTMLHGYMIFPSHGFCHLISDTAWRYFRAPEARQFSEYTKCTYEAAQMHKCFHQQSLQRSLITYRCENGNALCTPLPLLELGLLSLGHFCNTEFLTWYFFFSIFSSLALWLSRWHSKIF